MIFFPDIKIFVDQSTQRRRCGEQPSSRGNGVMCKVAFAPPAPPAPAAGQRLHKLCPTHSAKPQHKTLRLQLGKKRGNPQRIRGLKGLPVIMANGSNLVGGVNELVVSVMLAAQFEPQDDHLAGRPLSSPQTGPSSETHQHSALFGRFFLGLATFFACCSMLLHFFSIQMVHCGFFFLVFSNFLACCILCGKPQFRATCRFVPRVQTHPRPGAHCCNMAFQCASTTSPLQIFTLPSPWI